MRDSDQTSHLGVSLLQHAVLEAGHIFRQQPIPDYGIDAHIEIKEGSKPTGRLIAVQVKAGQSYFTKEEETGFRHYISDRHLELWLNHSLPVILVLCDVQTKICYYEIVTNETCVLAGGKWKILVPKSKTISPLSGPELADLASPIAAPSDFTIEGEHDESFAAGRILRYDVLVHPGKKPQSRALLGSIIRSVLKTGQSSQYFRNEVSERAFKGRPADVVSGFLYTRSQDRGSASHVCQFEWISPKITSASYSHRLAGETDASGLVVSWNPDTTIAEFIDRNRVSKAVYLKNVDDLLALLPPVRDELASLVNRSEQDTHCDEIITLVDAFEDEWDATIAPPAECQRLSRVIGELRSTVGNIKTIWARQCGSLAQGDLYLLRSYQAEIVKLMQKIEVFRNEVR